MGACVWRGPILGVSSMTSFRARIAAYADLLVKLKEIELLRKRVKQAEKLCTAKPKRKKRASSHGRAHGSIIH